MAVLLDSGNIEGVCFGADRDDETIVLHGEVIGQVAVILIVLIVADDGFTRNRASRWVNARC